MTKIIRITRTAKHYVFVGMCLVMVWGVFTSMSAAALSYAVEYPARNGDSLPVGTIIVVDNNQGVRPARQDEGQAIFGVIASVPKDRLSPGTVAVVSAGVASILVSDANGVVEVGDRITLSSIEGVGMKATTSGWMVGTAQRDFTSVPRDAVEERIITNQGDKRMVAIKEVPVLLSVSYYNATVGDRATGLTGSMQDVLEAVAGRSISADKALLAMIIFGIAMILLVTLIYSAVRSSILSIGRNPLAHTKIVTALMRVMATALVVIILTLGAIYLIVNT